jgi:hypothetical protein
MKDFSKRFNDKNDAMFLRFARNFFSCPTHNEMFSTALALLEEGSLKRN